MARISFLRLALMATFLIVASDAHTQTKTAQPTGEPNVQTQPGTEIKLSSMTTPLVFEPIAAKPCPSSNGSVAARDLELESLPMAPRWSSEIVRLYPGRDTYLPVQPR